MNWWLAYAYVHFITAWIALLCCGSIFQNNLPLDGMATFATAVALIHAVWTAGSLYARIFREYRAAQVAAPFLQVLLTGPLIGARNWLNFVVGSFWGMLLLPLFRSVAAPSLSDNSTIDFCIALVGGTWLGAFTFEAIGKSSDRRQCVQLCLFGGLGAIAALYGVYYFLPSEQAIGIDGFHLVLSWAVSLLIAATTICRVNRPAPQSDN